MKLIYNECLDFLSAVSRFDRREEIAVEQQETGISGIPAIREWVLELETQLSPMLQNDMSFIIRKVPVCEWIIRNTAVQPKICSTPEELLERLKNITRDQFIGSARISLGLKAEETISEEKILKAILGMTTNIYTEPEATARLIASVFRSPDDFIERTVKVYRDFYRTVWKQSGELSKKHMPGYIQWHQARLESSRGEYLESVSSGLYSQIYGSDYSIPLYINFFLDTDFIISTRNRIMIIGAATQARIQQKSDSEKTGILFSFLGDEKRLDIVRLLSKREWYSSELAEYFNISTATMSYHLNKLLSAGLISVKSGEQKRLYYLSNKKRLLDLIEAAKKDLQLNDF